MNTEENKRIMARNIMRYMEKKGVTKQRLCDDLDFKYTTFVDWINAVTYPRIGKIEAMANYFGCEKSDLIEDKNQSVASSKSSAIKIPVYGTIAAGIPLDAVEDILDYEEIPAEMARDGEYFALQIKGDSMEPRVYSGDVVIFRRQPDCVSGQTCAILINGDEATMKRVIKRPNGITLLPLNAKYEPINFTNEEVLSIPVAILGVAVEVRGKFM